LPFVRSPRASLPTLEDARTGSGSIHTAALHFILEVWRRRRDVLRLVLMTPLTRASTARADSKQAVTCGAIVALV
jgi:hypothetical protein